MTQLQTPTHPALSNSTFHWLLLHRLPGMTAGAMRRLCAAHGDQLDPARWLAWPASRLTAAGFAAETLGAIAAWQLHGLSADCAAQAHRDFDWLVANGAQLLTFDHPLYPPLLLEISDPPPWLYVRGDATSLSAPQLAVVGSRQPTRQGEGDAGAFAQVLAEMGFAVTSGLAYGVDAAAHEAALRAGGRTVAVMGSGLDRIYPATHRALADRIAAAGAVVSELPLGSAPLARHFPSRNRIISALSLGVLVVEAALRSGSLLTARLAMEQNREVFAIPGSIHNPTSQGCNELIRRGATLVRGIQDILDELKGWANTPAPEAPPPPEACRTEPPPELAIGEAQILEAVGDQPTAPEMIAERAAQTLPDVLATLSELELLGLVENRAGTYLRC